MSEEEVRLFLREIGGQLCISLYGSDLAGNLDSLLTNNNRQLFVEPYEFWLPVGPMLLPAAEANLLTLVTYAYWVEFLVANTDVVARTATVGHDVATGGALTAAEIWMPTETIPANSTSGWRGPFIVNAGDSIRGYASAANVVNIQWRIKGVART